MKDFLITLCLGWLGVHRFMQKKYLTGAIWLCTLGLCGIGWAIDTIIAFMKMLNQKQTKTENTNKSSGGGYSPSQRLVKSFDTEIVGTFAKCDLNKEYTREEVVASLNRKKSNLYLEYWEYKGEPAYYVCDRGLDAGNIRAGLAKILHDEYSECNFVVTLIGQSYYDSQDRISQKIRIDIYSK